MFLSKPGVYEPCGMFTISHWCIFAITWLCIILAVMYTKVNKKEDVRKIIIRITVLIWVLEVLKTIYTFSIGKGGEVNKVVPLYYCSLLLYSGLLSSVGKGIFKKIGDVFLATGGIVGGLVFLILPTTSLPEYPVFHFISIHSFLFHGIMIYLGIIVNKYKYVELKFSDIKYYAFLIGAVCVLAYIVNVNTGSNLMFISRDFPGTILSTLYNKTGKLYTPLCCLVQMTIPFILIFGNIKIANIVCNKWKKNKKEEK